MTLQQLGQNISTPHPPHTRVQEIILQQLGQNILPPPPHPTVLPLWLFCTGVKKAYEHDTDASVNVTFKLDRQVATWSLDQSTHTHQYWKVCKQTILHFNSLCLFFVFIHPCSSPTHPLPLTQWQLGTYQYHHRHLWLCHRSQSQTERDSASVHWHSCPSAAAGRDAIPASLPHPRPVAMSWLTWASVSERSECRATTKGEMRRQGDQKQTNTRR